MKYTRSTRFLTLASVVSLSAVGIVGCSSDSKGDEGGLTEITVGSPTSIFSLGLRTAEEKGLFEKHGLEVELADIQSAAEGAALLANGDVQFAQFDVHNAILAVSRGQDMIISAPIATTGTVDSDAPHGFGSLLVAADGDIKEPKDLEGKTIGTNTIGGTAYLDFYQKLEQEGVDVSKVDWVQVPSPQQVSSIKQGQIAAATVAEPNLSNGIANGDVVPLLQADTVMKGAPNFGYASSGKWASENPETVEKFRDALIEANIMLNSDHDLAKETVNSYMDLDAAALDIMMFPEFAEKRFEPSQIQSVADRLVEFDLLKKEEVPSLDNVILAK